MGPNHRHQAWIQSWISLSAVAVRASPYKSRTESWRLDTNLVLKRFGFGFSLLKVTFIRINGGWISKSSRLKHVPAASVFSWIPALEAQLQKSHRKRKLSVRTRNMQESQLLWQKWSLSSRIPSKIPIGKDKWIWAETRLTEVHLRVSA